MGTRGPASPKIPKAIIFGLGFDEFDTQGLYIQADFEEISVGSVLVPSGVEGPKVCVCAGNPSGEEHCQAQAPIFAA